MKLVRVLHVINRADHGGAEVYAVKLIKGLSKGIDHFVAYAGGGGILDRFQALPVDLFLMSSSTLTFRLPFQGFAAVFRLIRYVRAHRIDVIHAHLFEAYVWSSLVSVVTGIPLVRTVVSSRRDAPVWTRPIEWVASTVTKKIICFSSASRREMVDYGITASKVQVIPNGVDRQAVGDVSEARRDKARQEIGDICRPIIGTVGRLNWHKNQALMLRSAAMVISQVGGSCVVDGEGPFRDDLKLLVSELGIGDRVRFTGWSADVHALMSLFDVFVLSSVTEGVPNVVLEAMALGIPIVATDVGGVSDLVRDGDTGCLVPSEDQGAMTDAILRLLGDHKKSGAMSRRARILCNEKFSMDSVCGRIRDVYDTCRLRSAVPTK